MRTVAFFLMMFMACEVAAWTSEAEMDAEVCTALAAGKDAWRPAFVSQLQEAATNGRSAEMRCEASMLLSLSAWQSFLDTMDEAFLAQVRERAAQLRAGLAALPHVQQVSGLGLMVGIELADGIKAAEVRAACEREGLLVLTAKTRLRLLPPLTLSAHEVEMALDILGDVLRKMEPTAPKEQA